MSLRVVFFGTPDAAVPTLHHLLSSAHPVTAVLTAPDRPKGRGLEVLPSPVKEAAATAGLPVVQPTTLRDASVQAALGDLGADVFVVCAYGLILPQAVLDLPRLGAVNVHFSLLPAYRGAAPVTWAILDGQPETGVTIMQMEAGLDTGPMLAQVAEEILPEDDAGTLEAKLAEVGGQLLVDALGRLEAGTVTPQPQDDETSSYAAKITPASARIDWSQEGDRIALAVRAFRPRPGAWTTLRGRRLKVWRATPAGPASEGAPGSVTSRPGLEMVVATGNGSLVLDEVQAEGGRRMAGAEFMRGVRGDAVLE
ncbi:MAG: methionyl-tRNA formyltransferase [Actinomycetota bacterium]